MSYTIYRLDFSDGKCYIGMTANLPRRVREHRRGKNRSTKHHTITRVTKLEECVDSVAARQREKFWKSGKGRESFKHSGVEQSGSSSGS